MKYNYGILSFSSKDDADERSKSVVNLINLTTFIVKQINKDSENPQVVNFCSKVNCSSY